MFWYLLWQLWTASGITFLKRLSDDVTKAIFWRDWMHFIVLSGQETAAIVVGCYLVHLFLWLSHHVTVSSIAHFWHLQSASRHWLSVFCNLRYSYFYRAMLCIHGTSHGPVSVRPSVCLCLSVRPSQVGVLLKRLNVGSHKQHHTIVQGL